jgi:hypothetical protein
MFAACTKADLIGLFLNKAQIFMADALGNLSIPCFLMAKLSISSRCNNDLAQNLAGFFGIALKRHF